MLKYIQYTNGGKYDVCFQVGMISVGSPKVNFQYNSPDAMERLMVEIRKHITDDDIEEERKMSSATPSSDNNQQAYQVFREGIQVGSSNPLISSIIYRIIQLCVAIV